MKSNEPVQVELRLGKTTTTTHVTVRLNSNGELPVVLVDPLDDRGKVVPGMWLNRAAPETVYHWARGTLARRYWRRFLAHPSESHVMITR